MTDSPLPYRGIFGAARPAELSDLALPSAPMPGCQGLRPLKASRYVGVYGPALMLCAGAVRIGRALLAQIENGWIGANRLVPLPPDADASTRERAAAAERLRAAPDQIEGLLNDRPNPEREQ